MQLDGHKMPFRRNRNYQRQKGRDDRNAYRFEKTMNDRVKSIENALLNLESRIQTEVERRVASAVAQFLESPELRTIVDERVNEVVATSSDSSSSESSQSSSDSDSCSSSTSSSSSSSTCDDVESCTSPSPLPEEEEEPVQQPSCSMPRADQPAPHYTNKWEFISTLVPGDITEFRLEQFTQPVKRALKMSASAEVFPRMSLEEMIEHDHPTTSDSPLFDEQKITCKTRPAGKTLLDEEFFCLAPCCSASRLYQAATCPFLPSFVKKRMVIADDCDVYIQQNREGIELVTPIRWRLTPTTTTLPRIPPVPDVSGMTEQVPQEEEEEEEDPLANRDVVEQLMHEYFIPTPSVPNDDLIFGPYLKRVRESNEVPTDLLRSLVRRVNSNLDNSYKSHQELELFAELDSVQVDEKYGRLPFNPMSN